MPLAVGALAVVRAHNGDNAVTVAASVGMA